MTRSDVCAKRKRSCERNKSRIWRICGRATKKQKSRQPRSKTENAKKVDDSNYVVPAKTSLLTSRSLDEAEEELDDAELERLRDLEERDALANRIREKDKEKTKKMVEDRSSKEGSEARKRRNLADDKEARMAALPSLRERSRQEYLKLREKQQLELLRKQIEDEEFLFRDQKLTKREIAQHEYNKQVLALAEARLKIDTRQDAYMMPEGMI